jgi:hypothetical protein
MNCDKSLRTAGLIGAAFGIGIVLASLQPGVAQANRDHDPVSFAVQRHEAMLNAQGAMVRDPRANGESFASVEKAFKKVEQDWDHFQNATVGNWQGAEKTFDQDWAKFQETWKQAELG